MISVSRINGEPFFINPDVIEILEETPDTVITMASGRKVVVSESAATIRRKIIFIKRQYGRYGPPINHSK